MPWLTSGDTAHSWPIGEIATFDDLASNVFWRNQFESRLRSRSPRATIDADLIVSACEVVGTICFTGVFSRISMLAGNYGRILQALLHRNDLRLNFFNHVPQHVVSPGGCLIHAGFQLI